MLSILYFLTVLSASSFSDNQTVIENINDDRLKEMFPPEASTYFQNKFNCSHWMGEDGGEDEARSSTIQDGVKNSCSQLEKTKSHILKKFEKDKTLIALFKRADIESNSCGYSEECHFIFEDPAFSSKVLSSYYKSIAEELIKDFDHDGYRLKKTNDIGAMEKFKWAQNLISNRGEYFKKVTKNKKRLPKSTFDKYEALTTSLINAGYQL